MPGFICLARVTTRIADPAAVAKIFRSRRTARVIPLATLWATLAFILVPLAIATAVTVLIFETAAVVVATRPVLISVALIPVAITTFPSPVIRTTLAGITPLVTRTWTIPVGAGRRGVPVTT